MQPDFLEYYRKNLNTLRYAAEDFARAYPKIASCLSLSNFDCADPFVERLLEGSAFLASQVEANLDSGYARLLQQLVAHVAPLFNIPLPALACVQLKAVQMGQLPYITTGQTFTLPTVNGQSCTFSALWPLQLHPFVLQHWSYHHRVSDELPELGLGLQAKSVIACDVSLNVPLSTLRSWFELNPQQASALELFLNLPESEAAALYKILRNDQLAVYVRTNAPNGQSTLHQLDLLPCVASVYEQPSFLQEVVGGAAALDYMALYLHYPALCKFIRLQHLVEQWLKLNITSGRLIIVCKSEATLNTALGPESVLTHVLPLINVFAQRSNRTALTLRSDYQVHIDRTHPRDYEVLTIKAIECYDQQQRLRFVATPMTGLRPLLPAQSARRLKVKSVIGTDTQNSGTWGTPHAAMSAAATANTATVTATAATAWDNSESLPEAQLTPEVGFSWERRLPAVSAHPRSLYRISNVFVAFTGQAYDQVLSSALQNLEPQLWAAMAAEKQGAGAAHASDAAHATKPSMPIRDLGLDFVAQCYCSNGDLPYFLAKDAEIRSSNDVVSGVLLGDVTKMSPARLTTAADDDLQLLSFVLLNTTALLRQRDSEIVAYLQELLTACGDHSSEIEQLSHCIVGLKREHMTFRLWREGVVFFEEGALLTLTLDESFLGGSGLMFVAELLAQVLLSALELNAHAQLRVCTSTDKEVGVWMH